MALNALLRTVVDNSSFVRTMARFLANRGISPNLLSLLSLVFAALAGVLFGLSGRSTPSNLFLSVAVVFVCLNAILDGLDGLVARERGNASRKGDFLDHVVDRYSDVFIIGGIVFGGYADWRIGVVALIGVLLSSYMGTQAQAVGLSRMYGGLLGRADRMILIIAATVLTLVYPQPIPASGVVSFPFLGWVLFIFAIVCNATALQRFVYTWRGL
jgi:phosphatidylglycerophosphate synthase